MNKMIEYSMFELFDSSGLGYWMEKFKLYRGELDQSVCESP